MLIQTKRKQPECPIPLPHKNEKGETVAETTYFFKPVDPLDKHCPHVADVKDETHIRTFLRLDHYAPYTGDAPKELTLARTIRHEAVSATPIAAVESTAKESDESDAPAVLPQGLSDVESIVALSVRQLREALTAKAFTPDQLRAALTAERASGDGRESWCAVIESALA
ncbi:hypothetical protein [Dokdonella soli]|uniref:Uncharacterized protein n=1 Tax=Dokdonella soli TaxID=529810 RepID=A0ABN1IU70_9GAMM